MFFQLPHFLFMFIHPFFECFPRFQILERLMLPANVCHNLAKLPAAFLPVLIFNMDFAGVPADCRKSRK